MTLSRESRALIDAAREGDEPSAADRRRVRGALARKLAVGAAAGVVAATATHAAAGGVAAAGTSGAAAGTAAGAGIGAGAAAGSAGVVAAGGAAAGSASIAAGAIATGFGAKLLVSVAIVGAMSAGTVGYVRHEAAKRASAQTVAVERSVAPAPVAVAPLPLGKGGPSSSLPSVPVAPPAVDLPVAPAIAISPEVTSEKPSAMTKPLAAAVSPPSSGVAPPAPSGLDVELALLEEAHGALRANDGARALRLLDEHSRRFPNGALAEESEAARVFALCQVGRADEARDVAGRFLREHPRSLMAPRVTRVCDGEPSTF